MFGAYRRAWQQLCCRSLLDVFSDIWQVEKQKQDDALDDLSGVLGQLKGMAVDMGSEIDRSVLQHHPSPLLAMFIISNEEMLYT